MLGDMAAVNNEGNKMKFDHLHRSCFNMKLQVNTGVKHIYKGKQKFCCIYILKPKPMYNQGIKHVKPVKTWPQRDS